MKTILLTITLATAFSAAPLLAEEGMQCCCKKMAEAKAATNDKMDAKMKSADAQVAALLEKMNASAGEQKVEAMAALINTMLQDRKAMQAKLAAAHPKTPPADAQALSKDPHAAHAAAAAPAEKTAAAPEAKKSCCESPKAALAAAPANPANPAVPATPATPGADAPKAPAHQH